MVTSVKLIVHKHHLYPSSRFHKGVGECSLCEERGQLYGGYRCNESQCAGRVWFHKGCAESPSKISHPSHPQHHLMFIKGFGVTCNLCGTEVFDHCYGCIKCHFHVHTSCAKKSPPSLLIHDSKYHEHPLHFLKKVSSFSFSFCELCGQWAGSGCIYACFDCDAYIHAECVNLSPEADHPSHPNHPLKLLTSKSLSYDAEKTCILCENFLKDVLYHCSICNFSVCVSCVNYPPPLSIEHPKTHKHQISLLSIKITFTCNACGMEGKRSPYLCLQCGFIVHRDCIDLPRIVNINRHDHHISLTHQLGRRYLTCGVCHKDVNHYYGAYTCALCPNYASHSQCTIRDNVWDHIELEDIPEEIEDITSYKEVGENMIKHFSHDQKHNLRLQKNGLNCDERCEACIFPIYYNDPIFSCDECEFFLHKTCAKLPRKIRHEFHNKPLTLHATSMKSPYPEGFKCVACGFLSSGFRYKSSDGWSLDVHCCSISDSFLHDSHLHPLFKGEFRKRCKACHKLTWMTSLGCDACDFTLHLYCASLPKIVKHRYDEHPLSLCYGIHTNHKYWCDVCETEIDPNKWFYTCSDCGVALHVGCVFGDFSCIMPGRIIEYKKLIFEVIPNNHSSRPFCNECGSRCEVPFIANIFYPNTNYVCSADCLIQFS